jgi:hypothetical protein
MPARRGANMIQKILKFLLAVIVYTAVFIVVSAVMPYSAEFKASGSSDNPFIMLFFFVFASFICLTMYFIIRHARINGKRLFFYTVSIMFFVVFFLNQVESLVFGGTLYTITRLDAVLSMLAGLFPLAATAPLLIKSFQTQNDSQVVSKMNEKYILVKLGIIGIAYLCSYILLGLLMTWQFDGFQTHYGETVMSTPNAFINAGFQILRGILFGTAAIPLMSIIKTKQKFVLCVCLVYLCPGIQLILPNGFFPDDLRIAYLFEMTGAMLLFGIVTGNILWRSKSIKISKDDSIKY